MFLCCQGDRGPGEKGGAPECGEHVVVQHRAGLWQCSRRSRLYGCRDTQRDEYIYTKVKGQFGMELYVVHHNTP